MFLLANPGFLQKRKAQPAAAKVTGGPASPGFSSGLSPVGSVLSAGASQDNAGAVPAVASPASPTQAAASAAATTASLPKVSVERSPPLPHCHRVMSALEHVSQRSPENPCRRDTLKNRS